MSEREHVALPFHKPPTTIHALSLLARQVYCLHDARSQPSRQATTQDLHLHQKASSYVVRIIFRKKWLYHNATTTITMIGSSKRVNETVLE